MIRNDKGEFITLTGNQIGAMLLDYIIQAEKEFGKLSEEAFAVKTIVSTDIVTKICKVHGVKLYDVLTGFKFIGKVVSDREAELGRTVDKDYLLGFEESNGYNRGCLLYTSINEELNKQLEVLIRNISFVLYINSLQSYGRICS